MNPWAALAGAVLGAIMGSFLATLILRWPAGRSIMRGRSACDNCGATLTTRDLVPLFSMLTLKGRCRHCGARIDPFHGRIEAACAFIGAFAIGLAPGLSGLAWALLGWLLLTLALLDWRHFWLPDALTLPLAFLGFTIGTWANDVRLTDRIMGAVLGYGALLLLSIGYKALRKREGLGLGDAKLLGALGAWFGWQTLPFILLIASVAGLMAMLLTGRITSAAARVPLGSFLAVAALPGWMTASSLL